MNPRSIGWASVGAQIALLLLLVALPSGDDWATPGWVKGLGVVISVAGVVIGVVASLRLGTALTPTPVPSDRGQLTTTGLYRFVRHPIYTGVLTIVAGVVVRSGSVAKAVVALLLLVFFTVKARWEEQQLAERYPGYAEYAESTPRFIPRFFSF